MKVLIVKLSAIGDVVMALPMLTAIKRISPKTHTITWLCGKGVAPLLQATDMIDELIVVDEQRLLAGTPCKQCAVLFTVWKKLFSRRFDLIVTGHTDTRYQVLSITARAKQRRSFKRWCIGGRANLISGRYHGYEYVRLIDTTVDGPQADKLIWPTLKVEPSSELKSLLNNIPNQLICLAPGGASNVLSCVDIRRWPIEHYVELAKRLIEIGMSVVITGANTDSWVCRSFKGLDVINLVGRTSILDLLALYRRADVVVTHDSGPFHIAYLAAKPKVVALFGPTKPSDFVPPLGFVKYLVAHERFSCSPCYDGKTYASCNNNLCMQGISVRRVLAEVKE
ncbi:MAG: glycosyltransferase family 9 protein [Candidatus Magnetoovum sp. WYHC-5]|nr:glycosyltransferase family 9 protein [Candidatus Magnetoovum sp. WYHC-5]